MVRCGVHSRGRLWAERLLLAVIIVIFCFRVVSLHPREFFGFFQDDTIYFSTAKALATGHGYVFPSFPGVMPQTKYPILYPLILSGVWRVSPAFPDNLNLTIATSIAIAAAFLVLSYVFIRRSGTSAVMALCVLAVIALQPELDWFAGAVLSDYLFAMLVVASVLAADEAWLNLEHSLRWGLIAGFLLGLSMLARSAGVGAIAGVAFYGALQRRWRVLAVMLVACAVVAGTGVVATRMISPVPVAAGSGMPPPAFQQTAAYYSSYARFWMLSVPRLSVLGSMLRTNLRLLIVAPGDYFVMPGVVLPVNVFTFAAALLLTAASIGGIARLYRSTARRSMTFALLGSLPILLLWNYVYYDRFLIPFVPLLFLGIAIELRRFAQMLRAAIAEEDVSHRILAGVIAIACIGMAGVAVHNYIVFGRKMDTLAHVVVDENQERSEAYDWITRNSSPSARVIAYADGLTYLYTARQSARPIQLTTDCYYQPQPAKCTIGVEEMIASLRYSGAKFWITTPSDFEFEGGRFGPELGQRISDGLKNRLKPAFASGKGTVAVYDTTCLIEPKAENCLNTNCKNTAEGVRDGGPNCSF